MNAVRAVRKLLIAMFVVSAYALHNTSVRSSEPPLQVPFSLGAVVVSGATAFQPQEFLPLYKHLLGQQVTWEQLREVADAITQKYRDAGFVLSQAHLPAQRPDFGIVQLRVVEGYLSRAQVSGDTRETKVLRAYLDKIIAIRPARTQALQRYLLLINDLPGITASYRIRPLQEPGHYELIALVNRKPHDTSASVDNRGSNRLGPVLASVYANLHSALRRHERISLRATTSGGARELNSVAFGSAWPVGSEGGRVLVSGAYSHAEPGADLEDTDAEIDALRLTLGYEHSLVRQRGRSMVVRGRFRIYESESKQRGSRIREDQLRSVKFAGDYLQWDKQYVSRAFAQVSQGIDGLGADKFTAPGAANAERDIGFTKGEAELTQLRDLNPTARLLLQLMAQYSDDVLPFSERFAFGGSRVGRGYNPAEINGDRGVAVKMELRYDTEVRIGPVSKLELYGFYDAGAVWRLDPAGGSTRLSGTTGGGGLRFRVGKSMTGYLEFAKPLTRPSREDGNDMRVFARLEFRF